MGAKRLIVVVLLFGMHFLHAAHRRVRYTQHSMVTRVQKRVKRERDEKESFAVSLSCVTKEGELLVLPNECVRHVFSWLVGPRDRFGSLKQIGQLRPLNRTTAQWPALDKDVLKEFGVDVNALFDCPGLFSLSDGSVEQHTLSHEQVKNHSLQGRDGVFSYGASPWVVDSRKETLLHKFARDVPLFHCPREDVEEKRAHKKLMISKILHTVAKRPPYSTKKFLGLKNQEGRTALQLSKFFQHLIVRGIDGQWAHPIYADDHFIYDVKRIARAVREEEKKQKLDPIRCR